MRRREIRILFLLAAALTITGCMGRRETEYRIRSFLYLYPRNALEVSVQPEVQEQISCAYPSCEEEWRVIARPDGTMAGLDDGQEYSCLFRSPGTSLQFTGEREACRTGFRLRPGRIR